MVGFTRHCASIAQEWLNCAVLFHRMLFRFRKAQTLEITHVTFEANRYSDRVPVRLNWGVSVHAAF